MKRNKKSDPVKSSFLSQEQILGYFNAFHKISHYQQRILVTLLVCEILIRAMHFRKYLNKTQFNKEHRMNPKIVIALAKQLQECQKKTPDSVKVIINQTDITDIQAQITGPAGTPYQGGIYRCKLAVEPDFPESAPKGFFMTKIFHPNVSQKGQICVNTLKKDWDPKSWSIYNILEVVKCLLIVPFPQSALNQQAGKMFMQDYEEYFKHAKLINDLHAVPKELKVLQNNSNIQKMEQEKPEKMGVNGVKKENENRKKWMKRI